MSERERDAEEVREVVADSSPRGGVAIGVNSDAGAVAADALRLQRAAGNRATIQWLQRSGRLLQRAPLSWHQQRVAEIHAALEGDQPNWEGTDPPGAYRVFNGLSNEDQIRVFRGLSPADRKKLEDNLDQTTGDRARMYQAIQEAKAQAADSVAGTWWTDRANEVHSAIRQGKFVEYPEGAFWILNPHNEEARRRIIGTLLDAYHLDDLLDHEKEAIAAGVPNAKSICDEARAARAKRQPAEDWNFTRADYARVTGGSGQKKAKLTMASDSSWFPAGLQQNLINTLDLVFGPTIAPPATEGVNATDFFHGHLVIKKDPATASQTAAGTTEGAKVGDDLKTARTAALGKEVKFNQASPKPPFAITSGYPFVTDKQGSAVDKVAAYKKAVEKVEPSLGTVMTNAAKIPGAAVMYHTFEFNQPADLAAKGQKRDPNNPRRHYVTPLNTNSPAQYTPPAGGNYEKDYTIITQFSFLVDKSGAVHVRPFDPSTGFTSLELSTITGKPFAESPGFER